MYRMIFSGMYPVADPGFDLRGGVDFVYGGEGGRKSLKVLTVKVNVIFSVFWPHFY